MPKLLVMCVLAAALLCGCASAPPAAPAAPVAPVPAALPPVASPAPASAAAAVPRYRCDQGFDFTVRFADDTALLDAGSRGNDTLLRDAGGATPQQTVYSNPRMRAEFGLGATGDEAILRYAQPPLLAHCVRG